MRVVSVSSLAAIILALFWWWYDVELPSIQPTTHLNQYTCTVKGLEGGSNADTFSVLVMMPSQAIAFAESLCQAFVNQSEYSNVSITWRERGLPTAKELLTNEFDLLWNRDYVINGLVSNVDELYAKLGDSPAYGAYWVSQNNIFPLDVSDLTTLSIGLYDNQMSRSGYILPIRNLNEMGLNIEQLNITYFSSYQGLHDVLLNDEVDMVATFDQVFIDANRDRLFSQTIAEDIPIGAWFINHSLQHNNALICPIAQSLNTFAPMQFDLATQPEGCLND